METTRELPNLAAFYAWQLAGDRAVKIDLDRDGIKVWVYDYKLMTGQHVESVEEIDLEGKAVREARKNLERLESLTRPVDMVSYATQLCGMGKAA